MTNAKKIKILEKFKKEFPHVWAKPGTDFGGCDTAVIWSGEGSYIKEAYKIDGVDETFEVPAFDYYAEDPKELTYVLGIHKKLREFAEKNGLRWECNDPGTYLAYES